MLKCFIFFIIFDNNIITDFIVYMNNNIVYFKYKKKKKYLTCIIMKCKKYIIKLSNREIKQKGRGWDIINKYIRTS